MVLGICQHKIQLIFYKWRQVLRYQRPISNNAAKILPAGNSAHGGCTYRPNKIYYGCLFWVNVNFAACSLKASNSLIVAYSGQKPPITSLQSRYASANEMWNDTILNFFCLFSHVIMFRRTFSCSVIPACANITAPSFVQRRTVHSVAFLQTQ